MNPPKGISWYEAIRIAWFFSWRTWLIGSLAAVLIYLIGELFGIPEPISLVASLCVIILFVWPLVASQMLTNKFKGFELIIRREATSQNEENISS